MKENDKVLIAKLILKITFIMMIISVGIKLLGFNLFDADKENRILNFISTSITKFELQGYINSILLIIQAYIFLKVTSLNKTNKLYYLITFILVCTFVIFQYFIFNTKIIKNEQIMIISYYTISFSVLLIPSIVIDFKLLKNINLLKQKIKKIICYTILISCYQLAAMFLRNVTIVDGYNILYSFLLNIDYIILLLLTYYIYIKKEHKFKVKNTFEFSLIKFLNKSPDKNDIKSKLENINKIYKDFKKQKRIDKIVFILYVTFFIIQECLTLGLLIFIATINNYLIECFFIITAFMISKQVFGAFHFKSFILCFFVSNITFFILSKFTMDINITFVIPIICGVLLSYVASRFIKTQDPSPYRGIPEEDLNKLIENKKLTKIESGILIDYYSHRYNLNKIAIKYNYSDRSIQRIKLKALQKVET